MRDQYLPQTTTEEGIGVRVLFFTQKVDTTDDVLGFVCGWIDALARRVEHLHCVCLETGSLPSGLDNVSFYSLGRERGYTRLQMLWESQKTLKRLLWDGSADVVFVHMAPLYTILSFPWAASRRLPIFTWYVHRQAGFVLRLATAISDGVLTATSTSIRLKSRKIIPIGHGIDTHLANEEDPQEPANAEVLTVGRLSPIKRLEVFIEAAALLKDKGFRFRIVGDAVLPADVGYRESLYQLVAKKSLSSVLTFEGAVPYPQMPDYYRKALCTVNTCVHSSYDKTVLESMAFGKPPVTSNISFEPLFGEDSPRLLVPEGNPVALARKIEAIRNLSSNERLALGRRLQERVAREHGLERLIDRVVDLFYRAISGTRKETDPR